MKKQILNLSRGILFLLLCVFSQHMFAQNVTVRGTVTDTRGELLIGVTVQVHGTPIGTITDAEGNFTLPNIPSNATLEVSYVGMTTQTITLEGRTSLSIILEEDAELLEEVVVVGYGTQRREAVTGSVASVQGNAMREVPASNISQALQGRIAGVEMTQTSSQPGAAMQIRIRGTRSLNASNDPLVVLDGIPFAGTIGDINPNDIRSIDILKDASATAIYGSRGANGVILVTTFRGAAGAATKAQATYNGYQGIRTVFAHYPMMEGPEYIEMRRRANLYQNSLDERDDVNTDWQDLFYQTGVISSHDIGVAGATKGGGYNFGLGYYNDKGVVPTQQYTRYSLRGTFDQSIGNYFRFGITTNNNYNLQEGSNIGLFGILSKSPLVDPYNEDGSFKRVVSQPTGDSWIYTRETLKDISDLWLSETRGFGSYNNMYGEVAVPWVEGLKYRINAGLNFRMTNGGSFTGRGINNTNPENVSSASVSNSLTTNWAVENLVTYDRTFADVHNINVVGLYSVEQTKYNRSRMAARDIPADHFQFYNLGHADGEKTIAPADEDFTATNKLNQRILVIGTNSPSTRNYLIGLNLTF